MSRRKRKALALQREREMMHSQVRVDGRGEDPAVAAYLQQAGTASPTEMAELSLALDSMLKGDMSWMNDPSKAHLVQKLRKRAAEMEDAARRYEEDKEKFMNDAWEKADRVRPRGAKLDETIAKGTRTLDQARVIATANAATKRLRFREMIEHGPKRKIFVTGNPIMTTSGFHIEPEVINIMGFRMVLPPGEHDVPIPFAERYDNIKRNREENELRSQALSEQLRADQLSVKWGQIDSKFDGRLKHRSHPADAILDTPGVVE